MCGLIAPFSAEKCGIFKHLFFDSAKVRPYDCAPMSKTPIPRQADFRKLAAAGATVSGVVALESLERIRSELVGESGDADVELRFGIDDEGFKEIQGTVSAQLQLQCQRCLNPMRFPVNAELHLAMVWSEDKIPSLPSRFDGLVVGEGLCDLHELVEEELLLALPLAPRHVEQDCAMLSGQDAEQDVAGEDDRNPFAVLASMKGSKP
jgi:uncharacterized protein